MAATHMLGGELLRCLELLGPRLAPFEVPREHQRQAPWIADPLHEHPHVRRLVVGAQHALRYGGRACEEEVGAHEHVLWCLRGQAHRRHVLARGARDEACLLCRQLQGHARAPLLPTLPAHPARFIGPRHMVWVAAGRSAERQPRLRAEHYRRSARLESPAATALAAPA